jgi:nucleoside-diphosphate-sugar epimerase
LESFFKVGDINYETDWSIALRDVRTVIHLAARVHRECDRGTDSLISYRLVNVDGTKRLAEQAAQTGVQYFIFLSSAKVYGSSSIAGVPLRYDSELLPIDAYGQSKMEAEIALREIELSTQMKVTTIRTPLVYGPGVRAHFAELMRWISWGLPIPLGALYNNSKSLIGINNLVDVIEVCLKEPQKAAGKTFLVSDGQDISTAELIRRISQAMGKPAKLIYLPITILKLLAKLTGQISKFERLANSFQLDISHTCDQLNWSPTESLDQGLHAAVRGFKL